jgi:hypothetical protein
MTGPGENVIFHFDLSRIDVIGHSMEKCSGVSCNQVEPGLAYCAPLPALPPTQGSARLSECPAPSVEPAGELLRRFS